MVPHGVTPRFCGEFNKVLKTKKENPEHVLNLSHFVQVFSRVATLPEAVTPPKLNATKVSQNNLPYSNVSLNNR